jgi:hypothetical protein
MAGTLFGLGLSQQHDVNGLPMSGCLLYLYLAGSTTPAIAYSSPSLAAGLERPWPLVADSAGRIPAFWLADGAYRARLTDAAGIVQFDEPSILAVGSGSGDVFVSSTPPEAILSTGDVLWVPAATTRVGWVRLNGKTIGSASSGAGERANADCQALFEYLWATFADAICPVVTGRGGSAAGDWAAAKQLTLLDMRGKGAFGLDDMGNVAAGVLAGVAFDAGNATTGGAKGGDAAATLVRANLPNITLNIPAGQGSHNHTGTVPFSASSQPAPGGNPQDVKASGSTNLTINANTLPAMVTESLNGGVTQTAAQSISPFMLGSWFMRL